MKQSVVCLPVRLVVLCPYCHRQHMTATGAGLAKPLDMKVCSCGKEIRPAELVAQWARQIKPTTG